LLESFAKIVPIGLEILSGLERNKVYRILNFLVALVPKWVGRTRGFLYY
jgi:hypothetical protein